MKTNLLRTLILGSLLLFFAACSGNMEKNEEDHSNDDITVDGTITNSDGEEVEINNMDDLTNVISDALKDLNAGKEVEATDFRKLKELLPERLEGMNRINIEGEKTGMAGLKYSVAKAEYEKGDTRVDISIVDGAGFAGIINGFAAWSLVEVDRETESGYERTTEIDGYKAFEKYDSDSKDGQLSVIMEDRFIINIEAHDLNKEGLLRDIFKELDLKKLKKLQ